MGKKLTELNAAASLTDADLLLAVTDVATTATSKKALLSVLKTYVGTNPTITNFTEAVYAPSAGSAWTIDLANGTAQKLTTNANATITLPAASAGKSYTLLVAYGGAHTLTFAGGGTLKWAGGTAPTATSTSGKIDIYVFFSDGTNTYGADGGRSY